MVSDNGYDDANNGKSPEENGGGDRNVGGGEDYLNNNQSESSGDSEFAWSVSADKNAISQSLIESLVIVAGFHGRRTGKNALTSGLPSSVDIITPDYFKRAAERAGLNAKLTRRSISSLIDAPNLPCILVLKDGQSCVLWERVTKKSKNGKILSKSKSLINVSFPETSESRQDIKIPEIEKLYTGYTFFVTPYANTDIRTGSAALEEDTKGWFFGTLWQNRSIYKQVAIAAVFINLFALASPLYIMNVYDRVVPIKSIDTLWVLSVGVLIVYIFDFILKNLRASFLDFAGRKADIKISAMLFERITSMKLDSRSASAGILAGNMKDFESVRDFFTSATLVAFIDLPFVFLFIFLIWIIAGPVAFVLLAMVPMVVIMSLIMQIPLRKAINESMNESALKNALVYETISGLETIKIQAAEGQVQRKWEELSDRAAQTACKARGISAFATNWAGLIQQLTTVGVVVVGVFTIFEGTMSVGALIAAVILSGRAMAPLANVSGLLTRYGQSRQSLIRLGELMKTPVERVKGKTYISKNQIEGKIEFRDVSFNYPNQAIPALKDLNFTINAGEKIAVIGSVGSGKTTIERLILNLYQPTSGAVVVDDTDVRQIDPGDLRRNIGVVQQSPQLFQATIRENITMGDEMVPDRNVVKAAEVAGVMDFLRETPSGLDSFAGERGEALSGGQRQAVAVARAILYDPQILIMDEPTSSMDPMSENRLMKRLHNITRDKTLILITHKGPMLSMVDKIMLLERGSIVDFGIKERIIENLHKRRYSAKS